MNRAHLRMGTISRYGRRHCTRTDSSATRRNSKHHLWRRRWLPRFRVERQRGNRVTGTLVVRVNGKWLVAEPAEGVRALTGK